MTRRSASSPMVHMKKAAAQFALITLLWLGVPAGASSQELTPGTWSGTMAPPGAPDGIPVTFEVGEAGGALSIVMRSARVDGDMPFRDVRVEGSQLTFWWEPGVRVDCTLQRTTAGGFDGECTGVSGPNGPGRISMVPPPS